MEECEMLNIDLQRKEFETQKFTIGARGLCSRAFVLVIVLACWLGKPAFSQPSCVYAGTDMTGGGCAGNVTLNMDTTKVPQLNSVNYFYDPQVIWNGYLDVYSGTYASVFSNGAYDGMALEAFGGPNGDSSEQAGTGIAAYGGNGTQSSMFNEDGGVGIMGTGGAGAGNWGIGGVGIVAIGGSNTVAGAGSGGDGLDVYPGQGYYYPVKAAFFYGDVAIAGSLSKSSGSFMIDHPLDPGNRYLYHSFVESPDMKNIYDGVVVLDSSGEAMVQLPEWFEALNRDFRYQLTSIGGFAPVYISSKISGNQFHVAGGQPGMKVSWQVTGIRQDAWANAHRITVEQDKPERERGFYLTPELFGAPREKGIAWARNPALMRQIENQRNQDPRPRAPIAPIAQPSSLR
jgi:hypothetical protein